MKQLIFLLPIFFSFFKNDVTIIQWKTLNTLEWVDFQGKPNQNSPRNSISTVGLMINHSIEGDTLFIEATAAFKTDLSWVKNGHTFPDLLKHENYHFNIHEIYCRKFKQQLMTSSLTIQNYENTIATVFKETNKLVDIYQKQYDLETDHAKNVQQQLLWETKLTAELESLGRFKDPVVKIRLKH